ncbi:putative metalloreductase AIM14 [Nakaseomyces glabratus]|nr:putative metalloreductase AIM14 [Nakaseomyces glabratus]
MGEIRRPAPLESITLQKRHGNTHFANINYGYIVFFVSVAYVVFLILLRRIIKSYPSNKNRTFFGGLCKRLYTIDPALHLLILFIPLIATFYYHYSIFSQTAVYIMRLGRLSYVLLSLNLFLNLRPNIFFTDKYVYTDFIPFHKWLSRLIVIFGLLHGVFFVIRWAINPKTDLDANHPYTLATLPSDEIVELIVNEHTVPQFNTSSFVVELGYSYTIQNPHNPSVPDVCLQNANRIAIVCGGSGIAFGLPLFRFFKSMKNISYLRLVWLTKNSSQLSIITKSDSFRALISEDGKIDNLDIYLTNKTTAPTSSGTEETENDIELEDFELNTTEDLTEYKKLCNITEGERMDWTTELSSLVEEDTSKTWLLACGPEGLVTDGKSYANANGIHFASEVYTL